MSYNLNQKKWLMKSDNSHYRQLKVLLVKGNLFLLNLDVQYYGN